MVGVFGVHGELKCRPAAFGAAAFGAGQSYTFGAERGARELQCIGVRHHHKRLLLAFAGIATPEAALPLVGRELYATSASLSLDQNEYFDCDLVGLRVLDLAGRELGNVVGIEHLPAQDYIVVASGQTLRRSLVPLVKAFVRRIDLEAGAIVVDLPEGLLG